MNPALDHCVRLTGFKSTTARFARAATYAATVLFALSCNSATLAADDIPSRLFDGQNVPATVTKQVASQLNYPQAPAKPAGKKQIAGQLNYPPAAEPPADNVVPPAAETQYFPVRTDGQPYMLMLDKTVNLTDAINRFYYDPRWRGELWVPEDPVTFPEKATRLLSTFQEYDQQNIFRVGNGLARWIEKMSGFGP